MQQPLINFIIQKVSEVSQIPTEDINESEPMLDLGLSSFMMAEVSAAIEEVYNIKICLLKIANGATIAELAEAAITETPIAIGA